MKPRKPTVSIVCPALDEEESLPHLWRELRTVCARLAERFRFEFIFVDAGSSDGTLDYLRKLAGRDKRVRYVSLTRRFGHQAAFMAGIEHAHGDAVVLMDADLQHPPALLPRLLAIWQEGNEVVLTRREGHRRGALSTWFARLMRAGSATPLREDVSDYMLLSRRAADALRRLREPHRYLRGLAQWLGLRTAEVAFTPPPRVAGRSRFSFFRLLDYGFDALASFSRAPLRLVFFLAILCLLAGMGTLGLGLAGVIPGWNVALLASIHLVGAAILGGLGVLGEYVGRIFEQGQRRPLYMIQETERAADVPHYVAEAA